MDTQTLVAIAALVIANIGTTIVLFTWATNHAANDSRDVRRICEAIQAEMRQFHEEMKIIHGRVCTVEEKIRH